MDSENGCQLRKLAGGGCNGGEKMKANGGEAAKK